MTTSTPSASQEHPGEPAPPGSPAADPAALGARERLRWFGTLWAMAAAFHYTDSAPLDAILMLLGTLPILVFPSSLLAFGAFAVIAVGVGASSLPAPANHTVLSMIVGLAFGAAALWAWAARGRSGLAAATGGEGFGARWFEAARTPAALTLLVVYAFTVFHKLNAAFFDPVSSCAGTLLAQLVGMMGFGDVQLPPTVVLSAAIGTVIVEAAILVMLAVPRLCRWGLLLGVGFHALLAPASFYDFATMVFALYVLFVPPRVLGRLAPKSADLRMYAMVGFGLHMVISIGSHLAGLGGLNWHPMRVATWYLAVLPFMVALLWACLADRSTGERWPGWRWRPVVLLLVPLLAFANGAAPYLGLKTTASYSMFSNLHTEQGTTNHFLSGLSSLQVVDHQRDTVTITGVTMPDPSRLNVRWARWTKEKPPVVVPMLALRRVVQLWKDEGLHGVRVEYVHNGRTMVVPDAIADPVLAAPMSWWQSAFLAFRAVDSGSGKDICRW